MTEHSGEDGIHPSHEDDPEHEQTPPALPSGPLDSPFGPEHDPLLLGHDEHEDFYARDSVLEQQPAGEHLDAERIREDDGAQSETRQQTAVETALASPGGTVFDLLPDTEPAWLTHDEVRPSGEGLDGDRYATTWASDDGTGAIGVMHAGHDEEQQQLGWTPDDRFASSEDRFAGTIPSHLDALVYGDEGGPRETAARLWAEFASGNPEPAGSGGRPLGASELLGALSRRLDDPAARSVVEAVLSHLGTGSDSS